mgnify:CR=1 FL=1|tara:strand:- start:242 stop:1186 length:945 start_codon:yes stop_codon:yes gene_type:complete
MKSENNPSLITKFCPTYLLPFLELSRLDKPIGAWLLIFPCWLGSCLAFLSNYEKISLNDFWTPLACFFGAFIMRGAGCTWNDINDYKFDKLVERTKTRPLPAGKISMKNAKIWLLIQLLFGFLILLTFDFFVIIVGLLSLIPVTFYPFAKRITWWPQLFLGIAFNWGIILSYFSHTNMINIQLVFLYIGGILWTIFYDTIYAHQDLKDDEYAGVKSTARLFGKNTKYFLFIFSFFSTFFITLSFYFENNNFFSLNFTPIIIGMLLFLLHLNLQIIKLKIYSTESCLKTFKSNKGAGFIIISSFVIFLISQKLFT